ncbi:hypothetical protein RvY_12240 [Ramazzottius varieornatus]|uniref:Uncharacterized protein n=1 Tax=Ramazzottius varieornatus TaxID=947166 RepID=A0A1D1VRG8_RAMVA|nr:hypothetical protein RvY_12240 [Ramazzottius varieornatus]
MTEQQDIEPVEGDLIDAFLAEMSNTEQLPADSGLPAQPSIPNYPNNNLLSEKEELLNNAPTTDDRKSFEPSTNATAIPALTSPESDSNSMDDINFFSNASIKKKLETLAEIPVKPLPVDSKAVEGLEAKEKPPEVESSPTSPDGPMQAINGPIPAVLSSPPMHEFSIEDLLTQDTISNPTEAPKPEEDFSGIFKRPFSPGQTPQSPKTSEEEASDEDDRMDESVPSLQEVPAQRPAQKCFLKVQRKRRPETEASHVLNIVRALQKPGKLGLPDSVLAHYLSQAGMEVGDAKVARMLGAAAEHHTACIVQDAFQIYVNNHLHEKKRGKEGKEKDGGSGKGEKDKAVKTPNKIGRPPSSFSGKSLEKKKNSPKLHQSKTKSKKKELSDGDSSDATSMDVDGEKASYDSDIPVRDTIEIIPLNEKSGKSVEILPLLSSEPDSMDVDGESETRPKEIKIISSNVLRDERLIRKERKEKVEKEAERKNVLTLDILAPILREHGYQVGYPPYFVN